MKEKVKSYVALLVFLVMSLWLLCVYAVQGQCGLT